MLETLGDLPGIASGAGALGLLIWLVMRVMGQSASDRKEYQENLAQERKNHSDRIEEITKRHDAVVVNLTARYEAQLQDLQSQIVILKSDLATLQEQFEEERRLRWRAEDAAAKYRRQAGVVDDDFSN